MACPPPDFSLAGTWVTFGSQISDEVSVMGPGSRARGCEGARKEGCGRGERFGQQTGRMADLRLGTGGGENVEARAELPWAGVQ